MTESFLSAVQPLAPRSSLGEEVYRRLKRSIMEGSFPAGRKLTLRAVATALGVSTTPARDAMNRLLAEGALVNEGPKTVVLPELTLDALDEVSATRLALEGLAAERATPHFTAGDIGELERLQRFINHSLDGKLYGDVLRANLDFHFLVYRRSGWERLVTTIESQWLRVGPSLLDLYPDFAEHRKGVSNHETLMEALKLQDGAAAKEAICQDIRDGYTRLRKAIEDRQRRYEAAQRRRPGS